MGMFFSINAQNSGDQIFMTTGETIVVKVKKVAPNTITYSYVGEDLENIIEKDAVAKIIFKSGREQLFTAASSDGANRNANYEYPAMKVNQGAILPFEYIFEGEPAPEEGFEAQEFYYSNLMRRPERNTIIYQDAEVTHKRLRKAGINRANEMRDYEMSEIAKIVGAGILITGKITVDYRSTTSSSTGPSSTKLDAKKNRVKSYSSDYSMSTDEFDTKVLFRIYDKDGAKLVDIKRTPFMSTTRNGYVTALNYLMKRTAYYQKK